MAKYINKLQRICPLISMQVLHLVWGSGIPLVILHFGIQVGHAAPINNQFTIGVWQPAGTSASDSQTPVGGEPEWRLFRDFFFDAADRTNLANLGIDLLLNTPSIHRFGDNPPDSTLFLEKK